MNARIHSPLVSLSRGKGISLKGYFARRTNDNSQFSAITAQLKGDSYDSH